MLARRSLRRISAFSLAAALAVACGGDDAPWTPASNVVQLPGGVRGVLYVEHMNFPASARDVVRLDEGGRFDASGVVDRGSLIEPRLQPVEPERLPLVAPAGEVVSSRTADNARVPRA